MDVVILVETLKGGNTTLRVVEIALYIITMLPNEKGWEGERGKDLILAASANILAFITNQY